MKPILRIATWNLDRSGIRKKDRVDGQLQEIVRQKADIWVLTETHNTVALPGYKSVVSDPIPGYHQAGEACAAIWSRWPLKRVPTADNLATVCAELQTPLGLMLIYGTIITYGADGVYEGIAKPWELHRKAVALQTDDWRRLRDEYPQHALCVAGDFNMNLDGRRWYGVNDAKEAVLSGLDTAGMYCATRAPLQDPPYNLSRSTVDHICLSSQIATDERLVVWEGGNLSDHNGVMISLSGRLE